MPKLGLTASDNYIDSTTLYSVGFTSKVCTFCVAYATGWTIYTIKIQLECHPSCIVNTFFTVRLLVEALGTWSGF